MNGKCVDIHHAAQCGSTAEVKRFLSEGVSINSRSSVMGTPLMMAACRGDYRMLRYLIELGADPNLTDHYGKTALIYSILSFPANSNTKIRMVHRLLRAGANPVIGIAHSVSISEDRQDMGATVTDEDTSGCMGQAAKYGHFEIAEMCVNFGARPLPADKLKLHSGTPDATKKAFQAMANNPVSLQSMAIRLIREHVSQDKLAELPIPPAVMKDCFGLPNTPVANPKVEGEDPPIE
ncbi:ankyrin repeat domain-containing protein [Candidatus Sororendozoicomonas aggregata]|uniref:ankyrin repeat domain-containing protein n=1 Tax=Candidatus Sororendozoicomonas aggregata TaxID=3073239 RepID=UPI002ED65ED8